MGRPGHVALLAVVLMQLASTQVAESRMLWGVPLLRGLGYLSGTSHEEKDVFVPLEGPYSSLGSEALWKQRRRLDDFNGDTNSWSLDDAPIAASAAVAPLGSSARAPKGAPLGSEGRAPAPSGSPTITGSTPSAHAPSGTPLGSEGRAPAPSGSPTITGFGGAPAPAPMATTLPLGLPPPSPPPSPLGNAGTPQGSGCQAQAASECRFFFEGYEGQVPTFRADGSNPDVPISPPLKTNLKGSRVSVVNGNSAGADFPCADPQMGMYLDPNQFYATGKVSNLSSSDLRHMLSASYTKFYL